MKLVALADIPTFAWPSHDSRVAQNLNLMKDDDVLDLMELSQFDDIDFKRPEGPREKQEILRSLS